ncbi:SEC-C metal-binding domain-containing protein [Paenibacillus arenilitoris]|uniref:SEC-C domain-containing protein n=1 Tax=Paenibacillus arenilitoris TaxID=2772299 RepID=A0A927CMK9_9BACL|nr:SEC-C metal-binding domain-containing protein [Paenibacillus arenilitoris]MBD2870794.1 SEC-C domain-containing protein [Paenibacillus arenilitoris]
MFHTEQVKSFILHPEHVVSNKALRYFADSFLYENDTTLMPLLLERLKQSKQARPIHLFYGYKFPQTEETIRELLDLCQSPSIDPNTKFHLANMLWNSDLRSLTPYEEYIAKDQHWKKRVQQKRNLAKMDDRELVRTFQLFIEQSTGLYVNEFDTTYGDEIVNELSHRMCIDPDLVIQKLDAYHPDDMSYETPYFVQLAGAMKLEAAIPFLCGFLGAEDDWLPEKAGEALVQIGTTSVVTTVANQYFAANEEYFRLYASDVFGKIKLPASEEALLTLLPDEKDLTYATKLANGLCELGSSKVIPLVQAMVEGDYDRGLLNLTESIYAYCVISNTPHPSLSQWKKELDEEEARLAGREAELNRMAVTAGFHGGLNKPYTNPSKVGRNDPCPCGSGKKHKKCCGA